LGLEGLWILVCYPVFWFIVRGLVNYSDPGLIRYFMFTDLILISNLLKMKTRFVHNRSLQNSANDVGNPNKLRSLNFNYSRDSSQVHLANQMAQTKLAWAGRIGLGTSDRREQLREWLKNINEQPLDPRSYAQGPKARNTVTGFHRSASVDNSMNNLSDSQYSLRSHVMKPRASILSVFKNRGPRSITDFRKQEMQKSTDEDSSPGPNAYKVLNETILDRLRKRPGISMKGRHGSLDSERNLIPGPADYVTHSGKWRPGKNAYTITKSKRGILDPDMISIPGPGAYEAKPIPRVTGAVPFPRAGTSPSKEHSPGPGAYDTLKATDRLKVVPKCRFGNSPRFRPINEGQNEYKSKVSPLTYHPDIRATKERVPGVKFGSQPKCLLEVDHAVPGAGKYFIRTDSLDHRGVKFFKERRFLRKVGTVGSPSNPDERQIKMPVVVILGLVGLHHISVDRYKLLRHRDRVG
jgi:Sperm-tail PG-rich repeat